MPFVEDDLCEQLEERAQDARNLDRELSRALDGVTTPNLQTLKELRERCRDFVGVKLEARRELDSLCDAAEQWAKDARRILTDPHAKKAPTKARRLLEQLTEIKCGVGPMGITLQEQVAKADKWTEQALSVYEGGGDDYAALGKLVDAAEDVPAPRRALTACSRRHRFLQWVREARGALVACSVRAPGDHDEVIRPGSVAVSSFLFIESRRWRMSPTLSRRPRGPKRPKTTKETTHRHLRRSTPRKRRVPTQASRTPKIT